ncbi:hypothetical protein ETR_08711, partial [Erwinia tracheiphila PSU-1]
SILTEADFFPLSVRIDAAAGDRDMNVGMPVESSSVRMDDAENADIHRSVAFYRRRDRPCCGRRW